MEKHLLAAGLKSRESFDLISRYISFKKYSKEFQIIFGLVKDYYHRDPDAKVVEAEVLIANLGDKVRGEKHVARLTEMLTLALAEWETLSEPNVNNVVLAAKRQEVADELAVALTSGDSTKINPLLQEYNEVAELVDLQELDAAGVEVLEATDLAAIIRQTFDPRNVLRVYPDALNERLDGGLRPGHHLTLFARPECGKTAECITMVCGFAHNGYEVLYVGNEDPPQDILIRLTQCLTGWTKDRVLGDVAGATELALELGLGRIRVVSVAPGTPRQVEALIEKYEPDVLVVDQLRNLDMGDDNRVIQLEKAAIFCRNCAKKYQIVVISVTQAGDSADGKAVLDMGDVDFSNTGVPAAADVMLGIGMTKEMELAGQRCFTLCKNKVSGVHDSFVVRLVQPISKYINI